MKLSISMTRRETAFGWLFLAGQLLAFSVLIVLADQMFHWGLTDAELNFILYAVDFALTLAIFHRFLWDNAKRGLASLWQCLRSAFLGYLIYYVGNLLVSLLILWISPDFSNVNNDAIASMTSEHYTLMAVSTVFLVPLTEETLYRGLIFRELHSRSRAAAYIVSILAFSAIHVVGYIGTAGPVTLLLCLVQYFPAAFALAWAYERADSILAPVLIHMAVNQVAIASLR